ncbi:hypothetical protein K3495_g2259, partial [Podosphaera aphanis]
MSSLPKNFLQDIDPTNIVSGSRRQNPEKKGKQAPPSESSTSPSPPLSPLLHKTPLPRTHFDLPSNLPNKHNNDHFASLIQKQLNTALENFSLSNNVNLQQIQQQYQHQFQQMQQQLQQHLQNQQQQLEKQIQQLRQEQPPPPPRSPIHNDIPHIHRQPLFPPAHQNPPPFYPSPCPQPPN